MMDLPRLKKTIDGRRSQRATTFDQALGGYNHNLRTKAGEFYDMKNISLDNYPVIGTRQGFAARYLEFQDFLEEGEPHGLHEYAENTLMAVFGKTLHAGITADSDGTVVKYYDEDTETWKPYQLENSFKTFATIGTKTLIMPDKVIFDTSTGSLYNVQKSVRWDVFDESSFYYLLVRTVPCDIDGKVAGRIVESGQYDDEYTPTDPTDGMWWYRGFVNEWLEYKSDRPADDRWVKIEKPYTRLFPVLTSSGDVFTGKYTGYSEEAIGKLNDVNEFLLNLNVLDSLCISSGELDDDGTDYVIYGNVTVGGAWPSSWNSDLDHPLTSIVIAKQADTNLEGFEFRIKCPDVGHIFALNNRIWGVTPNWVESEDEPEIHIPASPEIFACKLGDPTQWYNYADTAADSFALTLGNDKEVTAGCAYNNTPHFFTEDSLIKIYGDYPSNYQTRTFDTDGVISGGHDTLVQVEGLLFWVSPIGVVAYEGSLPYLRSQDFEPDFFYNKKCVAGKDGTKYCLSVSHGTTNDGIFAYDTQTGMWARFIEDEMIKASELKNSLCYVNDQKQLVTLNDRSREDDLIPTETAGVPIEWSLETGNLGLDTPDQKYISRVQMRIDFVGSLNVDISYDDSEYLPVHVSQSDHMKSITVPIKVRRCDHFKLKLSGTGQMRLYSFGYETDEGSARCLI